MEIVYVNTRGEFVYCTPEEAASRGLAGAVINTGDYSDETDTELINQAIDRVEEVLRRGGWNIGYNDHPAVNTLKQLRDWGIDG